MYFAPMVRLQQLSLVQFRNYSISWVGDNCTEDTSNVTGSKSNNQLFALGALFSRLGHDMSIRRLKVIAYSRATNFSFNYL